MDFTGFEVDSSDEDSYFEDSSFETSRSSISDDEYQTQVNDSINTNSNSDATMQNSGESRSTSTADNEIVHSNSTLKNKNFLFN